MDRLAECLSALIFSGRMTGGTKCNLATLSNTRRLHRPTLPGLWQRKKQNWANTNATSLPTRRMPPPLPLTAFKDPLLPRAETAASIWELFRYPSDRMKVCLRAENQGMAWLAWFW